MVGVREKEGVMAVGANCGGTSSLSAGLQWVRGAGEEVGGCVSQAAGDDRLVGQVRVATPTTGRGVESSVHG